MTCGSYNNHHRRGSPRESPAVSTARRSEFGMSSFPKIHQNGSESLCVMLRIYICARGLHLHNTRGSTCITNHFSSQAPKRINLTSQPLSFLGEGSGLQDYKTYSYNYKKEKSCKSIFSQLFIFLVLCPPTERTLSVIEDLAPIILSFDL